MTAPPDRLRGGTLPAIGFIVGAGAGLVELLFLGVDRWALMRTIMRSRDVVWMAPLTYAITFASIGLLLWLITRHRGGLRPDIAVGLPVFLACSSVLLLYAERLHLIARLLLATGVALHFARLAGRHGARLARSVTRFAVAAATALMVVAALAVGGSTFRERQILASLPDARAGAPNVLLIILDTVRAMELSLYGYDRPTTPVLSRFALTGVTFNTAVSAAPWTVPSHATLFTGYLGPVHHADWYSRLDPDVPTLARVFRNQGYRTGGFTANEVHAGWEFGFARDFMHFEDHDRSLPELVDNTTLGKALFDNLRTRRLLDFWDLVGRTTAGDITANSLEWLDRSGHRPFFVFLNYFDAHTPLLPPEPFAAEFGAPVKSASLRSRLRGFLLPSQNPHKSQNAYDASIAYIDNRIGALLQSLGERGMLENTLVIITADHGELLGEHGLWGHANSLYFPTLHVPLILSMPGTIPSGERVEPPVTLRDVPATILDLAGVQTDPPFPGISLARHWDTAPGLAGSPVLSAISGLPNLGPKTPISRGDMVSLVRDSLHYIRYGDGVEELYNIRQDTTEIAPLGSEFSPVLQRMRQTVDSVSAAERRRTDR
jgi:arylsulfatase A-like enzyme